MYNVYIYNNNVCLSPGSTACFSKAHVQRLGVYFGLKGLKGGFVVDDFDWVNQWIMWVNNG